MTDDIYSLPKTRKEAKEVGSKYYYTGKPCKRGHTSNRSVDNSGCEECQKQHTKKWYEQNKERVKATKKKWHKKNPEYYKEYSKKNSEKSKEWYKKNPEYLKNWRENNRATCNQYSALYCRSKTEAQPSWADTDQLNLIYQKRYELNKKWSTDFQVDHIIPLQSKTVCGLHCPDNLQLLDKSLNISKRNSYTTDW